jgi:hypothetical protein
MIDLLLLLCSIGSAAKRVNAVADCVRFAIPHRAVEQMYSASRTNQYSNADDVGLT